MNVNPKHLLTHPDDCGQDEGMTLGELWRLVCSGWRLMLAGLLAALLVAGIFLVITPSRYEATVLVRIGKVGMVDAVAQARLVEPPDKSQERALGGVSGNVLSASLGWTGDERERLLKESYQVTVSGDESLRIRLRGYSPEDARRAVEASVAMLSDAHRALAEALIVQRSREHAGVVADIAEAEAFLRRIKPLAKEAVPLDKSRELVWLQALNGEMNQKSQLRTLRHKELALAEAMKPDHVTPTRAVEPAVVSSRPVEPKAQRVWVSAILGGVLLGLLLVTLRELTRSSYPGHISVSQDH